jgi:transcriptional regulator of acetoin/glycerol metabolism
VNLPALRVRNDLEALIRLIVSRIAPAGENFEIAPEVMDMFLRHPWPGNIRQLSNLLRTAIVMAGDDGQIRTEHLPDDFLEEFEGAPSLAPRAEQPPAPPAERQATDVPIAPATSPTAARSGEFDLASAMMSTANNLEATTLNLIQRTLEAHQGNVSAAARQLGISRNTLYRKLRQIWQI